MAKAKPSPQSVVEKLKRSDVSKVKVAVTDLDGIPRGRYMHTERFLAATRSHFGICNVILGRDLADQFLDNIEFTGWPTGFPDMEVRLDLSTYRSIPWEPRVPLVIGEFIQTDGSPLPLCPRQLLKAVVERGRALGFIAKVGIEYEWTNFLKSSAEAPAPAPVSRRSSGYSLVKASEHRELFNALMDQMEGFEVPLEGLHLEAGPGVFESAIAASDPLTAADRGVLFKMGAKEISQRFGITASFMAKWSDDNPGAGGHIHVSLWNQSGDTNVLWSPSGNGDLTQVGRHFLAGLIHGLPHVLPMYAPTVNSYKRLVEGQWAPTRGSWGTDNRTAAFRWLPVGSKQARIENRVPGADMNPYLAIAATLACGFFGIEKNLPLDLPAANGDASRQTAAQRLAGNLYRATSLMAESDLARDLFGPTFLKHFVATRQWEWRQYQHAVTDWEIQRYLEMI